MVLFVNGAPHREGCRAVSSRLASEAYPPAVCRREHNADEAALRHSDAAWFAKRATGAAPLLIREAKRYPASAGSSDRGVGSWVVFFGRAKKMNKNNWLQNSRKRNVRDCVAPRQQEFDQDFPEWYKKTLRTLFKTSFLNKTIRRFLSLDSGFMGL